MAEADHHSRGEGSVFFPGGNTRYGFHSFFDHIAGREAQRIYILKGGPGVGKSTFMNRIAREITAVGYAVEYHICASDTGSTDAVYFPEIGVAVMDGTSPHTVDPRNPGVTDLIINLGEYWDAPRLRRNRDRIRAIGEETAAHFAAAYAHLAGAGACIETRDALLQAHLPVDMDPVAEQLRDITEFILSGARNRDHAPHLPGERHLFLSAITPQGIITGMGHLSKTAEACWAVKDDTSLIAHFVIEAALDLARQHRLKCWVFHCGLDPERLEHCFFPDIGICIVTARSGALHKLPPGTRVLRAPESTGEISRALSTTLRTLDNAAEDALHSAVTELSAAKTAHGRLEHYYVPAMDFSAVDDKCREVTNEILNL